ncbi:30S ribosomal protein S1 [Philodulcilactobacillus myokoensis]|uniref:30S ribosomal protein S1 n=1 Tax=Philodulcilactobacillus myokoensis TaxID=2929573 RepID=A0A9W6B2E7_9LACO|nr:30S ribosomal protein S1 [Philodulcilactobacillus myokoensis]GLB46889.1 30S ribosomal protein S1 [Philodulcilactobacillus myokoensis]
MSETDGNKNKELMNALNSVKKVNVGDVVNAEVLAIDDNKQLIVGIEDSGVEGVVPPRELSSKPINNINDAFKVGDKIKVLVVTKIGGDKEGGSYVLSIRRVQSRKAWDEIQAKADAKETIKVPVSRAVRGGLVVDAGVRGFIPASMITDHFVRDLNQFKGQTLECKIIEVVPEKNRLILSHRAIVEEDRKAARDKVMSNISEGDTVEGKVARLTNFGAFIDLGGIDGLVHISQISYAHVDKPSDVLKVGQEVKVKVMSIDQDRGRISLSMKALEPEPWDSIEEKAPKGSIVTGTVKRLVDFGAFVEVIPGVEGLLHISQISHQHVNTPSDVLKVGQEVKVKVLDVQPENHRLSLSMRALEPEPDRNDGNNKAPRHNVNDNSKTNAPTEENGFTLGDIVGNELKKEENKNNKNNK